MSKDRDRRHSIIAAARRCFSRTGFLGTSTRAIAQEASVAQSLILYHFTSKQELWREVMGDSFSRINRTMMEAETSAAGQSIEYRIKATIRAFVQFCAEEPEFHRLMTLESAMPGERLSWLVDTFIRSSYQKMTQMIAEGQTAGIVRAGNPSLIHYSVIAIAGTAFSAAPEMKYLGADTGEISPDQVAETIFTMILCAGEPTEADDNEDSSG